MLSDYFRRCALEGPEGGTPDRGSCGAGNNLNQVAHHLNATGDRRSRGELDQCIADLKVAIARVISL
jgi:hypothetical protein